MLNWLSRTDFTQTDSSHYISRAIREGKQHVPVSLVQRKAGSWKEKNLCDSFTRIVKANPTFLASLVVKIVWIKKWESSGHSRQKNAVVLPSILGTVRAQTKYSRSWQGKSQSSNIRCISFFDIDSVWFPVVFCWSCCPVILSHMVLSNFNSISVNALHETKFIYGSITDESCLSYWSPNL